MDGSVFVYYWILFAVLVPVFSAVVFLLAKKAGFFKNQYRLRYLALWAEVPEAENGENERGMRDEGRKKKKADVTSW